MGSSEREGNVGKRDAQPGPMKQAGPRDVEVTTESLLKSSSPVRLAPAANVESPIGSEIQHGKQEQLERCRTHLQNS